MIEQIVIAIFGVVAVYLSQDHRESVRRWSCVFGLIAQPFWFYAAWRAEQWGIFFASFAYTYSWLRGVRTYWTGGRAPDPLDIILLPFRRIAKHCRYGRGWHE